MVKGSKINFDNCKYLDGIIKRENSNNKFLVISTLGDKIEILNLIYSIGFGEKEGNVLFQEIEEDIMFVDWLNKIYSKKCWLDNPSDIDKGICSKIMEVLNYFLINSSKFKESQFIKQVNDAIIKMNDLLALEYASNKRKKSKR